MENIDIWKFLAGLGLFLFGMNQLEKAVKELAGRRFKGFIRRHTKNKIKAILGGTFITAVLQSSSVVSLMLLAFVGAGVISMQNALGVILGSNLGTTFTGWLVATLGFKVDIESFIMPFIAIGGLLVVLFPKRERFVNTGFLTIGLAFLFLGLSYMKDSITYLAEHFDVSVFVDYGPVVFLLVGFVFTAIIQSSSATMVITLSALSTGIINFHAAAAMVIGADLGTTITVLLGGLQGTASKKRVALGHFLFNLITDVLAFLSMSLLIMFVTEVLGIRDELIGLVVFHSCFNILGIIVFYPFLGKFAKYLTGKYSSEDDRVGFFIHETTVEVPETALEALSNETRLLTSLVIKLYSMAFMLQPDQATVPMRNGDPLKAKEGFKDLYHRIKRLQGEMINFYGDLQKQSLTEEESSGLSMIIAATNNALYAAKDIKDIEANLGNFRRSGNSTLTKLYGFLSNCGAAMIGSYVEMLNSQKHKLHFEGLGNLMIDIQKNYDNLLNMVYDRSNRKHLSEEQIATVLNVNRQLYSSNRAIILVLKDHLLNPGQAYEFENIPAFR
ncbi:MAG: Na/Pi cotransporter family protein [Roseivirga sp.]|nr:Na/Pi cotransporter family protein [Roseivirga sp.]